MRRVLDMVKDDQEVTFVRLFGDEMWYVTDSGFEFPVPLGDTVGATFMAKDRAIFFVRWIRHHVEMIERTREEQA